MPAGRVALAALAWSITASSAKPTLSVSTARVNLDEAGISNPKHEPFVVVAGILVNADSQWKMLEKYLSDIADDLVPHDKRENFVFHAMDLFHGSGAFDRDKWPKEKRWEILDYLIEIPDKFKLPIVAGFVERAKLRARYPDEREAGLTVGCQAISFSVCTHAIETYMTKGVAVQPDEVALVVMEDNQQARRMIRLFHDFNRNPRHHPAMAASGFSKLIVTRIIDTVHFSEKTQSSPLQVADVCAFAIKRHLMKTPESERFYSPLRPWMVISPKSDLPPAASAEQSS
jgi:hypothetical protein